MDLNYANVHSDSVNEYSLFFTFDTKERCYMSVANKITRITDKVEVHKENDKWYYAKYELDPALQIVVEFYYKDWLFQENCEFIGMDTPKLAKRRAYNNCKDVASQDFELDKVYQINSFRR